MRSPFSPIQLLLFLFLLGLLLVVIQVGILTIAFGKLGLSQASAFLLLLGSLFGSAINLPLFTITSDAPEIVAVPAPLRGLLRQQLREFRGKTLVAVNVGGCLIPVAFSLYLIHHNPLGMGEVVLATATVTLICYLVSRPVPGVGVGMPILIAPFGAAVISILVNSELSAPLAYISGTLGVLIGADLFRLGDIRKMATPIASIGGAGTFDGIFLTGIVAVLLA